MGDAPDSDPVVHVMCGPVGGGKTTLAKLLAREHDAVRFTRDEWMIRLHGLVHDDPEYARRLSACTDLMWDVAASVLAVDRSVVLDWNHWSRDQRREANDRATAVGARLVVHHLDVSLDVAVGRAESRTAAGTPNAHVITAEDVRQFASIFEPPTPNEGIEIVVHGDHRAQDST